MAIEIVDFPIKHGGSFHSYVKLPEGNHLEQFQSMGRIIMDDPYLYNGK